MSSFCVLQSDREPSFIIQKLDINIWLLPGILGSSVVYCDLGLKLKPVARSGGTQNPPDMLEFDLGLPFLIRDSIEDLSSKFYTNSMGHKAIANAVFGNSETPYILNSVTHYDDGSSVIVFPGIDREKCRVTRRSEQSHYTTVRIVVPNRATGDESNYVRMRFRVDKSRRLWRWHSVSGRRLFAVSDVRVNEFREIPVMDNAPDFANQARDIEAVHCLAIFSSKLRVTQVNPQPRYIRVLERSVWETYLQRRVSRRSGEMFVITYWRQVSENPHSIGENPQSYGVTSDRPFRAYLDVERRGVRFGRWTIGLVSVALLLLVLFQLEQHMPLVKQIRSLQWSLWRAIAAVGVVTIIGIAGVIYTFKPEISRISKGYRRLERWWYRER